MTCVRKEGQFSKTDLGTTYTAATVGAGYIWQDDIGNYNALWLVWPGISITGGTAQLVHENLDTHDQYVLDVNELTGSPSTLLNYNSYAYYSGWLYFAEYAGGGVTKVYRYDGAGTLQQLGNFPGGYTVSSLAILGTDNKIYIACTSTAVVLQIDPSNPTDLTNYWSLPMPAGFTNPEVCVGLISDGSYIFSVWRITGTGACYIANIYDISEEASTYLGDSSQYTTSGNITCTDLGWQMNLSDGSWHHWTLTVSGSLPRSVTFDGTYSGGATGTDTGGTQYPYYKYYRSLNNLGYLNNIDADTTYLPPSPWNENPYFQYRNPGGSGSWVQIPVTYPNNPGAPQPLFRIMPITQDIDNNIVLLLGYAPEVVWNIDTWEINSPTANDVSSPYSVYGKHNGYYYYFGYPYDVAKFDASNLSSTPTVINDHTLPEYPYFCCKDKNNVFWLSGTCRDHGEGHNDVSWWDPSDESSGGFINLYNNRSIGISADGSKILVGYNDSTILVFDADSKALDTTIDISTVAEITDKVFVADVGTGVYTLAIVSNESNSYKLVKVNLSTGESTGYNLPAGIPFGFAGSGRIHVRFKKGPDGYYYFFGGSNSRHLYAVSIDDPGNPVDLGDLGGYYMPTFLGTTLLLNHPTNTHLYSIDMFDQILVTTSPLGIEGGQPGGMPGGRVDGI